MNSNQKRIKNAKPTNLLSKSQSARQCNKGDNAPKPVSKQKKVWTSAELSLQMNPSAEEIKYRKKKIETVSSIEKYSRYFNCTKCQFSFKPLTDYIETIAVHSFLNVLFCKSCLEFYEDGEFSVDSDGEEKYCRWCGEGGLIYSCSECVSGFCTTCIKKHFGMKYNAQVKRNNNWKCFLCFSRPLWFLRLICSIVVEETNKLGKPIKLNQTAAKPKSVESVVPEKTSKAKDQGVKKLSLRKELFKIEKQDLNASCSKPRLPEIKVSESTILVAEDAQDTLNTSFTRKGVKRKNVIYSSSDESEDVNCTKNVKKKIKVRESMENSSGSRPVSQNGGGISPEIIEKLEKILRLAEYQMGFGVSWSSKMLNKLCKPDSLSSVDELKNECQKIKWFFSILSTYLVESCSSVDYIEKSIESIEPKKIVTPEKSQLSEYSTVVKFLDFVTNQVKVFLEKGIQLQDLLEGEIYYDKQVIGIKVRSNTSASAPSPTFIPRNKIKVNESEIMCEDVENGGGSSGDESKVSTLEREPDGDTSDTDIFISKLNLSGSKTKYLEEAEEQKTKIQEILSILENA